MTASELIAQRKAAELQSRLASPELRARILADPFIRRALVSTMARIQVGSAVDLNGDESQESLNFSKRHTIR